mgnify:FL=1|jgi:hypothetical protein|tara:strand:- start:101 stop:562 length:462 start_codon:yes stop_codon:yes gene_type:complete
MIFIYDFDHGMQDYIGNLIGIPYQCCSWTHPGQQADYAKGGRWDDKKIVILSKPFDCYARGIREGKYNEGSYIEGGYSGGIWHHYNGDNRMYENINNSLDNMSNKFIIHPYDLLHSYNIILKRLEKWIDLPDGHIQFNPDEYWKWYQENVNQL